MCHPSTGGVQQIANCGEKVYLEGELFSEFYRESFDVDLQASERKIRGKDLMQKRAWKLIGMVLAGCGLWASVAIVRANGRAAAVATGASEIGGAVASAKGP